MAFGSRRSASAACRWSGPAPCTTAPASEAESLATIQRAIDLGITFFDTAEVYGPHVNEELLGRAVRGRREGLVIATKFGFRISPGGVVLDSSPENVRRACDGCLTRLGIDTIDLFYQHRVDPKVPIEETVGAVADLIRAGKVRHVGLSEVSAATLRRAAAVHPIAALQSEYSLWERGVEERDPAGGARARHRFRPLQPSRTRLPDRPDHPPRGSIGRRLPLPRSALRGGELREEPARSSTRSARPAPSVARAPPRSRWPGFSRRATTSCPSRARSGARPSRTARRRPTSISATPSSRGSTRRRRGVAPQARATAASTWGWSTSNGSTGDDPLAPQRSVAGCNGPLLERGRPHRGKSRAIEGFSAGTRVALGTRCDAAALPASRAGGRHEQRTTGTASDGARGGRPRALARRRRAGECPGRGGRLRRERVHELRL